MNDFEECSKKGLIKDLAKATTWVDKELKVAERFIKSTEANHKREDYETSIITGYLVVFHINRALVYHKGKIAKTHHCTIEAVKRFYSDDKDIIDFMKGAENILTSRNLVQYEGYTADDEMSTFVLNLAKDYFDYAKELIKK